MTLLRCRHLLGNLVRREKIVCVQPLNIVALAKLEGLVSGGGRALILLRHNGNIFRSELPRNRKRAIARSIVNDNDLLPSAKSAPVRTG